MDISMTTSAQSNNLKPMLARVTQMMMTFLCLFAARTLKGFYRREVAPTNSYHYSTFSLTFIRFLVRSHFGFTLVGLTVGFCCIYPFFALIVELISLYTFLALFVFFLAFDALSLKSVFSGAVFIKLRNGFSFFAHTTFFCYDWLRHVFSLIKKSCLGPVTGYGPVAGSFYFTTSLGGVKSNV